jgi:DNA-binding beta-propeller fold protein YncE
MRHPGNATEVKRLFPWLFGFCISLAILFFVSNNYAAYGVDAVVDTIAGDMIRPYAIAYNSQMDMMYVANYGQDECENPIFATAHTASIVAIDGQNNIRHVRLPIFTEDCYSGIAYDSHKGRMYVTTGGDDSVIMIDGLRQVGDPISVDDNPIGIAYNPIDERIYTANKDDNDVSLIRERSGFRST